MRSSLINAPVVNFWYPKAEHVRLSIGSRLGPKAGRSSCGVWSTVLGIIVLFGCARTRSRVVFRPRELAACRARYTIRKYLRPRLSRLMSPSFLETAFLTWPQFECIALDEIGAEDETEIVKI